MGTPIQGLAAIAALLATGYGFGMAGVLGGLTGLVAVLGVGSGLAIATAESGTGVTASGGVRAAQRIGGFLAAGVCLTGAVWGGWTVGWLWGLGGYIAGAAAGVVLSFVGLAVGIVIPRKKLLLEAAIQLVLNATLRRDHGAALAEIATAGPFEKASLDLIKRELPILEIALWHLQFLQYAEPIGAQEVTKRFTVALASAYVESGLDQESSAKLADSTMHTALSYLGSLDSVNPDHLEQAGFGFGYCQVFTGRVLPSVDLRTEQGRDQHFQAFDLAKQALRVIDQTFAAMLTEYRVLVS